MTTNEVLAERHIKENEARLKHIDELMTQVQNESGGAITRTDGSNEHDSPTCTPWRRLNSAQSTAPGFAGPGGR